MSKDYSMPFKNRDIDELSDPRTRKQRRQDDRKIKKQNQAHLGKKGARVLKTIGKIDKAMDQGKKKKAKRLTDRVNRITDRIFKK